MKRYCLVLEKMEEDEMIAYRWANDHEVEEIQGVFPPSSYSSE
jgi:hypothetical protein